MTSPSTPRPVRPSTLIHLPFEFHDGYIGVPDLKFPVSMSPIIQS